MTEKAYDLIHYLLVSGNEGATTSHPAFQYLCDYIEDLERKAHAWDALPNQFATMTIHTSPMCSHCGKPDEWCCCYTH